MKEKSVTDNQFLKKLGDRIIRLRKRKNKTQEEFVASIDISQSSLERYEKGLKGVPVLVLKHISDEYDYRIEDFFIEKDTPSEMLKAITFRKTGRRKYPKRTNRDDEFDEYMNLPENDDKLQALYHASRLSEYIPPDINKRILSYLEYSIPNDEADTRQKSRLALYMKKISEDKKGDG